MSYTNGYSSERYPRSIDAPRAPAARSSVSPPPRREARRSPMRRERERERSFSRSPPPRGRGRSFRSRSRSRSRSLPRKDRQTTSSLFCGNIPYHYTVENVRSMFEPFGPIADVSLPMDRNLGHNKGISFIEFRDRRDAEEAMRALVNTRVDSRTIRLDWDVKEKSESGDRRYRDRRDSYEDRYRPRPRYRYRSRSRSRSYSRSPRRRY